MAFQFTPLTPPPIGLFPLIDVITAIGLTTNLKLCLDAGDAISAGSAGGTWADRSGNGYNFNRGTLSSSDSADPTFNGTQGRGSRNEYWSFDGGDFFRYSAVNETWMNTLHKDNAVFTVAAWIYATAAGQYSLFGTDQDGTVVGCEVVLVTVSPTLGDIYLNVGVGVLTAAKAPLQFTCRAGWNFVALSFNETTTTGIFQVNGTQQSVTSGTLAYTAPSAANAGKIMEIGATGNAGSPFASGGRMATFAMWQGTALSAVNLARLFNSTRSRFDV